MSKRRAKSGLGFTNEALKQVPFRPAFVLKLMIHNYAYDVQCEGDRSWYAFRFFKFSKHKKKIARTFRNYLLKMPEDLYGGHKDHVFEVAARLWKAGYLKRKDIIEVILHHHYSKRNDWGHLDVLLKLGKKGIRQYVNEVGKSHVVEKYRDYYPYEKRNNKLLKLLKTKNIRYRNLNKEGVAFIKDLKNWQREAHIIKQRFSSFEEYLTYVSANTFRGREIRFFQTFTEDQVEILKDRLKEATSPDVQYGLLAPLVELDVSGPISLFLPLANSDDQRVKRTVARILAKSKSVKVRKKALRMIGSSADLRCGIEMLSANVEAGDDELIRSRLNELSSKHDLHDCGYGLLGAVKRCAPSLLASSLNYVYSHSRCSICRKSILKQLDECGRISKRELAAAHYDASSEVRSYAKSES